MRRVTSATIRFEPIAMQIAKHVSAATLLPNGVLEEVRDNRQSQPEPKLPPKVEEFTLHYFALARAACSLLSAPWFNQLNRLMDAFEEEYMPGGPPQSPIYDSFHVQHVLGEVPVGAADETPYSVLVKLTLSSARHARFHALARSLAEAHLDVYAVTAAKGLRGELSPIRGGSAFTVNATAPFFERGDLVLARVLPFEGEYYIADSPYLLREPTQEWLAYFERVAATAQQPAADAARTRPKGKLSAKQEAKWRQRQRLKTQSSQPDLLIRHHLKRGNSDRFWLDYVMDAYTGERRGIVYLAGVPDRPESLPHSPHYRPRQDEPPLPRIRRLLQQAATDDGMRARAEEELELTFKEFELDKAELDPNEERLFIAYTLFGARSASGVTALEAIESRCAESPELRALHQSLRRGGFAVMRLDRIHLDQGFEVFELRSGKELFVSERSATRQTAQGEVLIGWLYEEDDGTWRLEGHIMQVPLLFAGAAEQLAEQLRGGARRQDFRKPAGTLPLQLLVGLRKLTHLEADVVTPALRQPRSELPAPPELPPELSAQLCATIVQQIRGNLDSPIPQFNGKTLRQVARGKRTQPDAVNWLREQERLLKSNPQFAALDMRPLWAELGLRYQGLDTDPAQ